MFEHTSHRRSSSACTVDRHRWRPTGLLGRLSPSLRDAMLDLGVRRRFRAGQVLMREGDRTTHAVLIRSGYLKVTAEAEERGSVLLAIRPPGDLVGEQAALNNTPRMATITAPVEATGNLISQAELLDFLRRNPAATPAIMGMIGDRLRMANRRRMDISSATTRIRVARILTELAEWFGRDTANGRVIAVPLTQDELADLAGVSGATIQRTLRELREAELIANQYRSTLVRDPRALRSLACERSAEDPII
jgi:CRP/FNR family cyclic AMP-dependent transcriptional regulator